MYEGFLTTWISEKAFGFLRIDGSRDNSDNRKADVYVHLRTFEAAGLPEPTIGNRYLFDKSENPRNGKMEATALRVAQ